jgi:radical SAM protein with 4Fe4S-binding SPASM domain
MLTPHGSAADHPWLAVEPGAAEAIFRAVCELDRTRYGLEWGPQPPLVGGRCLRHQFSCLVTAAGDVFPCVGVTIPLGNVRERRLAEIIRDSEVLQDLRNYRQTVKGPCRECERAAECYGCRGTAYQLTGDYLASDPSCWRNRERQQAIERFPIPIDGMLPQRAPMRVVDRLLRVGERTAEVEWVVDARSPFVRPDGAVDPSVYLELMAQSIAALNGFRENGRGGREPRGLLLGARGIQVNGCARVGDRLVVHVNKYARYGGFGLVRSRVVRDGEVLASGEVKVWHQGDEADPAAPAAAADGNARPA